MLYTLIFLNENKFSLGEDIGRYSFVFCISPAYFCLLCQAYHLTLEFNLSFSKVCPVFLII